MRLIDADALKEAMYHEAFETDSDLQKWDSGCWIRYKMFEKHVKAAPTIDPVKRGKWVKKMEVKKTEKYDVFSPKWYCPSCGEEYDPAVVKAFGIKFCYKCGEGVEE